MNYLILPTIVLKYYKILTVNNYHNLNVILCIKIITFFICYFYFIFQNLLKHLLLIPKHSPREYFTMMVLISLVLNTVQKSTRFVGVGIV